jgi:L-lactate utilization protein LutB
MYYACHGELFLQEKSSVTNWAVFTYRKDEDISVIKPGDVPYYASTHEEALKFVKQLLEEQSADGQQIVLRYLPVTHF